MGFIRVNEMRNGITITGAEVYIKSFEAKPMQKKKQDYGTGFIEDSTGTMPFKVWEADLVEQLKVNAVQGKVLSIDAECQFSTYSNCLELKITAVNGEIENPNMELYVKSCDVEGNRVAFNNIVNSHMSPQYAQALMIILSQQYTEGEVQEKLFTKFKVEQAAHSVHDALRGGLLNHTLKMCKIMLTLIDNDKRLETYKNDLMLGVILHDIGKTMEYNIGEKTNIGFVTHHVLGVELIAKVKDMIIPLIGEDSYYRLLSVIQGHHGEYGDRPTSIYAYIVHLVDMLDSKTTSIAEMIEHRSTSVYGGNDTLKIDGYNLVI